MQFCQPTLTLLETQWPLAARQSGHVSRTFPTNPRKVNHPPRTSFSDFLSPLSRS